MNGRLLVTARCRGRGGRGHTLAELVATPDGVRLLIPHPAVGHAKGSRVINRRGAPASHALDSSMSMTYLAMCAHGVHAVHERDLTNAAAEGIVTLILDPLLL
jgi:hypothetical protein